MKILQLCKKIPFPSNDGESIAVSNLARALSFEGAEIDLLSFNTTKHWTDLQKTKIPEYYNKIEQVYLDNRIKVFLAFANLFSSHSYHIERYISSDFEKALINLLQSKHYDIIQMESLFLAPYIQAIRKNTNAKIVMRAHNLEYEIWENIILETSNPFKKNYLKMMIRRMKDYEIKMLSQYDLLVTISDSDFEKYKAIGKASNVFNLPVGMDLKDYISSEDDTADIFFIGSLDWQPNELGLIWFIEKVFPIIKESHPDIKLHIAGRNGGDKLNQYAADQSIVLHGEVEDAIQYMRSYHTMIVPLFSGSGIRVKILEGLALSKSIVATSKAVEGIQLRNEQELLIADEPDAFAQNIMRLIDNQPLNKRLKTSGRKFIEQHFDNEVLGKRLYLQYQTIFNLS